MKARHKPAVTEKQQRLDQPGNSGSRYGMADVALDAAERAEAGSLGGFAEGIGERLNLDGIAERSSRTMGLDVPDAFWRDIEALPDGELKLALGSQAGCGEAVGPTVLVDTTRLDDADDAVAIGNCLVEQLQHHGAHPFRGHEAIGGGIEGLAATVWRKHARVAGQQVHAGRGHQGNSAREGRITFSGPQRLAGKVNCHERGRTCGIDSHRRSAQVQVIGDAGGKHRAHVSHAELRGHPLGCALGIVTLATSHEDGTGRAVEVMIGKACIFERKPCGL